MYMPDPLNAIFLWVCLTFPNTTEAEAGAVTLAILLAGLAVLVAVLVKVHRVMVTRAVREVLDNLPS
jgi:hypothetical protein